MRATTVALFLPILGQQLKSQLQRLTLCRDYAAAAAHRPQQQRQTRSNPANNSNKRQQSRFERLKAQRLSSNIPANGCGRARTKLRKKPNATLSRRQAHARSFSQGNKWAQARESAVQMFGGQQQKVHTSFMVTGAWLSFVARARAYERSYDIYVCFSRIFFYERNGQRALTRPIGLQTEWQRKSCSNIDTHTHLYMY